VLNLSGLRVLSEKFAEHGRRCSQRLGVNLPIYSTRLTLISVWHYGTAHDYDYLGTSDGDDDYHNDCNNQQDWMIINMIMIYIVLIPLMLQIYRNCCCLEQLLILHWHDDPGWLRANGSGPLATRRDEFIGALCARMRMMRINGYRSKLGTSRYLNNSMVNIEQYWTYGLYSRLSAISLNSHTKIHAMFTKCTCQVECWTSHQLLFVESLEFSDHNGSHIEAQHMKILRFAMDSCDINLRENRSDCAYGVADMDDVNFVARWQHHNVWVVAIVFSDTDTLESERTMVDMQSVKLSLLGLFRPPKEWYESGGNTWDESMGWYQGLYSYWWWIVILTNSIHLRCKIVNFFATLPCSPYGLVLGASGYKNPQRTHKINVNCWTLTWVPN